VTWQFLSVLSSSKNAHAAFANGSTLKRFTDSTKDNNYFLRAAYMLGKKATRQSSITFKLYPLVAQVFNKKTTYHGLGKQITLFQRSPGGFNQARAAPANRSWICALTTQNLVNIKT